MFNLLVQTESEIEVRSLFDDLGIQDKQQVVSVPGFSTYTNCI